MIYQWQLAKKWRGKVKSAEFGNLEIILEADTWHHSEKVAGLQMSEIATACSITQISTPQHVFLKNFPYILNRPLLQNTLDSCLWVISNVFILSFIFNNIYKKMWEIDKKDTLQEL